MSGKPNSASINTVGTTILTYSSSKYLKTCEELHVTVASIGTKRKKIDFEDAVRDCLRQKLMTPSKWRASFWPCQSDPCLR